MNDEKAWSENFGPFCLVGRKSDRFDRKVGDIRKNGRDEHSDRGSETELGIQLIELKVLLGRLRSGQSRYLVGKYDHRDRYTNVRDRRYV